MRLPIIKHINEFVKDHDEDYLHESVSLLEHLAEAKGIKDEELEVIGELLSNIYGALEVRKEIRQGKDERDALNDFMKRVMGAVSS